jgi:hypothetical protein
MVLVFLICATKSEVRLMTKVKDRNGQISADGTDQTKFIIKDDSEMESKVIHVDSLPERRLGKAPGPQPVIAPVQFPGILNPDIYIQNTQSAPVFPHLNAPPVNLNLHLKGLDKYYNASPKIIHQVHHTKVHNTRLNQLIDRFSK